MVDILFHYMPLSEVILVSVNGHAERRNGTLYNAVLTHCTLFKYITLDKPKLTRTNHQH